MTSCRIKIYKQKRENFKLIEFLIKISEFKNN